VIRWGLVLRGASDDLISRIEVLVAADEGAELVRKGKPRTTLERLFLKETLGREGEK
jgi:ABC-2 type transport system ATP-binding protein